MHAKELKEIRDRGHAFAREHVAALARELVAWQDTGLLCDGKLRELACALIPMDAENSLKIAERFAERAALEVAAPSDAEQAPDIREQAAKIAERHNYTGGGIDAARKIRAIAAPVAPQAAGDAAQAAVALTETQMAEIAHECAREANSCPGTNMWQCAHMAVERTLEAISDLQNKPGFIEWQIAEVCEDADGAKHVKEVIEDLDDIPVGTKLYAASVPPAAAAPSMKLLGEMREGGVVWFDQNPHAFPIGTRYFATVAADAAAPSDERAAFEAWHIEYCSRKPMLNTSAGTWDDDKKAWDAWQAHATAPQASKGDERANLETLTKLRMFLNAAGGEGFVLDGVDAGDLYMAIFDAEGAVSDRLFSDQVRAIAFSELFEFQEATWCDTAAEYRAAVPQAEQRMSDAEDAARYRYLRSRPESVEPDRIDVVHWSALDESANEGEGLRGDALDAAIDAARKGASE